jgi:NTE family protein
MLRALTERGIHPDLLVGTSIGAVNAAAFAGTPTLEGVYLAAESWRRIGAEDVFPRGRFHGTWRLLERREGLYSMEGLRSVVTGLLRFERLEDSPIPLVVVASRLEDGAEEWISEGPALEAILASAALPGLFPVVELGGLHYFDGGVLDNVALSVALQAGAERVFVLLCNTVEGSTPVFARPYEAMFAAFRMALHGRLRRDLASVPPGVDVVVFEQEAGDAFDPQDFSRTEELIEQGYASARDVLDAYFRQVAERRRSLLGDWRARLERRRRAGQSAARPSGSAPEPAPRPAALGATAPGPVAPDPVEPAAPAAARPEPDGAVGGATR